MRTGQRPRAVARAHSPSRYESLGDGSTILCFFLGCLSVAAEDL